MLSTDPYLHLNRVLPAAGLSSFPTELDKGRRDNLAGRRTFGCRGWVRPPSGRRAPLSQVLKGGYFYDFSPGRCTKVLLEVLLYFLQS